VCRAAIIDRIKVITTIAASPRSKRRLEHRHGTRLPIFENHAAPAPIQQMPEMQRPVEASDDASRDAVHVPACDKDDPIKQADSWLKGDLKPPE